MFNARKVPKAVKRRTAEEEVVDVEADNDGDEDGTAQRLAEVRQIQREHWQKSKGVQPNLAIKKTKEAEEEEEEDQWGLLDSSFAGSAGQQKSDPHLEAFLSERLGGRKSEEARQKTREEQLYEVPDALQVADGQSAAADKMSWVAGLAEVPLGVEFKLANIEATEKAKRDFLHGERKEKGAVLEPDAVTRKAFGSRFLHFNDRRDAKHGATDDAVLERFRKRMRK
mmetsp:Transcript_14636/g.32060  ORF Transcript_14636/g.32060 Transcript_14636/m.32060 type:complete len:226 (-) Transcript_14636:217-894(-)